MGQLKILIIIPAYNEAECIEEVIERVRLNVPQADIVVVNDGSTDSTCFIARRQKVVVLDLPFNVGIGGAVQTGYKFAAEMNYDVAIQVDGDGQHPAEEISKLLKALDQSEVDMVIGSRYLTSSQKPISFYRKVAKGVLAKTISLITGQQVTDSSSGFRAANREVIEFFAHIYPEDYPEPETVALLIREGFRVKEIPIVMNPRITGQSSITSSKGLYYVLKVLLATLINIFEQHIRIKEQSK